MEERFWEINGNLFGDEGLENIELFSKAVYMTKKLFDEFFGSELMNQVPLYVDNATNNSGYTPITTVCLNKIVIVKLGIGSADDGAKVVFQFAHELMHVVFYAIKGLGKTHADGREESICTAASLMAIKEIYPERFDEYFRYVNCLENVNYRLGAQVATNIGFSWEELLRLAKQ